MDGKHSNLIDILLVRGIPKFDIIANVAALEFSLIVLVAAFATVVIVPSSLF
jgi:hypothetical protein